LILGDYTVFKLGTPKIVKLLLDNGADVSALKLTSEKGYTEKVSHSASFQNTSIREDSKPITTAKSEKPNIQELERNGDIKGLIEALKYQDGEVR
jgi:hypothetical protein